MKLIKNDSKISVKTFYYSMILEPDSFTLVQPRKNVDLINCPSPIIYWPEFYGHSIHWAFSGFKTKDALSGPIEVQVRCEPDNAIAGILTITIRCFEEYFEISGDCTVNRDCILAKWNFFQPGSRLGFFNAYNFRSRHGKEEVCEKYYLAHGPKTSNHTPMTYNRSIPKEMQKLWDEYADMSTYSYDWQFAPHPSFLMFQRDEAMFCMGSRGLPHAFGLDAQIGQYYIHQMSMNYGGEHGYPLKAGGKTEVARMYMWIDYHRDLWGSVDHYVGLLKDDDVMPKRDLRGVPHWWYKPVYCTWHDQGYLAKHTYSHLHKTDGWAAKKKKADSEIQAQDDAAKFVQQSGGRYKAVNAEMVTQVIETIKREKLPFGSIILDSAWYGITGQWEPDPNSFPDMRKTIEEIHEAGLKAIFWMSVFMMEPSAKVAQDPENLINRGILFEEYPKPVIDYSHPKVQEEYVRPTMRYLFSDEPGCLNADGLKLDYFAAKIFPAHNVYDLNWRGEEAFMYHTVKLFNDEMKKYKPDACMIGVSVHPMFTDCQDLIRTYDVEGTQKQHEQRGIMVRHFCPDNILSLDFVEEKDQWEEYFKIAEEINARVEFSNILGIKQEALDDQDYHYLRKELIKWE